MKNNLKRLDVEIHYHNIVDDDIDQHLIKFTCHTTKKQVSMIRLELMDLNAYDKISAEEARYFEGTIGMFMFNKPAQFSIMVSEKEYNEIFFGQQISKEEDLKEKQEIFTMLNLKMFEIMKCPKLFMKYTEIEDSN